MNWMQDMIIPEEHYAEQTEKGLQSGEKKMVDWDKVTDGGFVTIEDGKLKTMELRDWRDHMLSIHWTSQCQKPQETHPV